MMKDEKKIKQNQEDNIAISSKVESPWKIVVRRLRKNKLAMIGLVIITIMILGAVLAPVLTSHGRDTTNLSNSNAAPSRDHLLGTDALGRDLFTRLLYGARISLTVGFVSTSLRMVIGVILGGMAGFYGGKIDGVIMRIADIFSCLPFLPIAITFVAMLGPSIYNVMLVLAILGWPGIARIVRAEILSLREREFMEAATALGISDYKKITSHLIPNTMASIIVSTTIGIAGAILTESSLSFLGLGVRQPNSSWGSMLKYAQGYMGESPYLALFPGILILLTVLSFNILGDIFRIAFEAKANKD